MYTPVVKQGNTKKFSSFWRSPYAVIDKSGPVNYKVQLIGDTQTLLVDSHRIKPCYNACNHYPTVSPASTQNSHTATTTCLPLSARDMDSGIAGYTTTAIETAASPAISARPARTHCLPDRLADYVLS